MEGIHLFTSIWNLKYKIDRSCTNKLKFVGFATYVALLFWIIILLTSMTDSLRIIMWISAIQNAADMNDEFLYYLYNLRIPGIPWFLQREEFQFQIYL